jgi:hypothetical protein
MIIFKILRVFSQTVHASSTMVQTDADRSLLAIHVISAVHTSYFRT